jgi:cell wall-associated protease
MSFKLMVLAGSLATLLSTNAFSATIAVIDSGVDYKHNELSGKIWTNQNEIADNNRDEDGNGYQDDIYGWNFAESNNQVIDYKYLGTFSPDPYKFFEIQGRMFMGTATEQDIAWVKSKRGDEAFIKEMGKFGNFVHGTHVAGITVANNPNSDILSVKLIPTETKLFVDKFLEGKTIPKGNFRMKLVKAALAALADQQMKLMTEIAVYVDGHNAPVANGSFGTGFEQAKMITGLIFKGIFFRAPTDDESYEVTKYFMDTTLELGKKFVGAAPNTLFVFAAGNSGSDNDKYPTSPTNVDAPNVISVAATLNRQSLATFSCYGEKTVDIAAPGVIIESTIPGNLRLRVSGTSQAAPYIASVALRVKESNPALNPAQIKEILMGTIDPKEFLKGKIKTGGIVNRQRAIRAGQLSKSVSVAEAIVTARQTIANVSTKSLKRNTRHEGIVLPLPSMFR